MLVGVEPSQAATPVLDWSTDEQMHVSLNLNVANSGDKITGYELSISTDGLTYSVLSNYDGYSANYVLDLYNDELEAG